MSALADELHALTTLDRAQLVERWTAAFGCQAPRSCQAALLRGALSWHLQRQASAEWARAGGAARLLRALRVPPASRSLAPGTRLLREWRGRTHAVTVDERGFEYDGKRYRSLTAIARRITGSPWSGPLFFGLRG